MSDSDEVSDVIGELSNLGWREEFKPIPVVKNPQIVKYFLNAANIPDCIKGFDYNEPYELVELSKTSSDYLRCRNLFLHTMGTKYFRRRYYKVDRIQRVRNPFLLAQFHLKEIKKREKYGSALEAHWLFHGTKECNIDPICRENFNWRLVGANGMLGSKFGRGVSFSPRSDYASNYPRRYNTSQRVMFVVRVLEGSRCIGDQTMKIPPEPHDTSAKADGKVIVKYEDNEFYPQYVIYYSRA